MIKVVVLDAVKIIHNEILLDIKLSLEISRVMLIKVIIQMQFFKKD
jgi:hypothetical protein